MKSGSTTLITQQIKDRVKGSNGYSFVKGTYIDDDGSEVVLDDLQYPVQTNEQTIPPKYANVNYTPASADCSFKVINRDGAYSPKNTGSADSGIFVRDRVVKFYDGTYLSTVEAEQSVSLGLDDAYLYFTKTRQDSLGEVEAIELDINNTGGNTDIYFNDLFPKYGSALYGSAQYGPDGYAVWTLDREHMFEELFSKISVAFNSTSGKVYYQTGNDLEEMGITQESDKWTYAGDTIVGTKEFTLGIKRARYIRIAVIFDSNDWNSGIECGPVSFYFYKSIEWTLLGTFYLDQPRFGDEQSPSISTLSVTGRNAWKRALDTEINIDDLSSGVSLDQLVKDIADQAGIEYTASSIADLSAFGNRTLDKGYGETVKVNKIFENIMQVIGRTYRIRINDSNVLFIELRPTAYLAETVFNYRNYIRADQKYLYDKQLQRIGLLSDQKVLTVNQLLATETFSYAGEFTVTWSGAAYAKYYTVTVNSGDGDISTVEFNDESMVFTVTGDSGGVDITVNVYGSKWAGKIDSVTFDGSGINDFSKHGRYIGGINTTYLVEIDGTTPDTFKWSNDNGSTFEETTVAITGERQTLENGIQIQFNATTGHTSADKWYFNAVVTPPDYYGEGANPDNIENNKGLRTIIVNPLVISSDECKTTSENFISDFGVVAYNVDIKDAYINPLPEINDPVLFVSEDFFEQDIYELIGIKHIYDNETSKHTTFTLLDTGRDFTETGEIVYERDLYNIAAKIQYDIGIIYDSKYRIGITRAEILAQTTYLRDTGF